MSGLGALLRKELLELVRTHRLLVVLVLFFLLGVSGPLLAKLTPQLMQAFASDELGGMELVLVREPGVQEALFQYQKNLAMLPILVVLLSMGAVGGERRRGIAPLVLTKPVSRRAYLLAKLLAPAMLYLTGVALSAGLCLFYTQVLFGEVALGRFALLNLLFVLTAWCYLSITLLASVLFSGAGAAAGAGIGAFALLSLLAALGSLGAYTPGGLLGAAADLTLGKEPRDLGATVAISVGVIAATLLVAERRFSRQEL